MDVLSSQEIDGEERFDILGDMNEEIPDAVSSGESSISPSAEFDDDLGLDNPPPPSDIPKGTVMGMPAPELEHPPAGSLFTEEAPLPPPPED